ncbi:MAG: glycosyltransferase family 4 protein, partial [Bacteroidales bacterium]|nr:glycosyltransferase family 4 protein [Bacteroidales bacterium]
MKRIFVSVSNDVYNDNRVKKTCRSLNSYGLDVHVLCKKSLECNNSSKTFYKTHPIKFFFKRNFLYYAELNTKLFFKLIFKRIDILWANDLDTLLPLFIISKLRNKPLIYDSHELFTQVPELNTNPFAKKIWLFIEKHTVPKLKYVITVCNPIKDYFKKEYNIEAKVVRNIPLYNENNQISKHYPLKEKIIVWQGAANIDRS